MELIRGVKRLLGMGFLGRAPKRDPRTYALIGAAMEVHRELGNGYLEPVYQEAFERACQRLSLPIEREVPLQIDFGGEALSVRYRPDFIAYGSIIVELKAVSGLNDAHAAQVIHYLKASGFGLGLLINFGAESLECRRLVFTQPGRVPEICDARAKFVPPSA